MGPACDAVAVRDLARRAAGAQGDGRASFISFASWTLIRDLPHNGPPQSLRRLRHAHLFFEVHFNGSWAQYIDSSVRILTTGMQSFWGSSQTFPGPLPAAPFQQFFSDHEVDTNHYYCAYPQATVTLVRSALALEERLEMWRCSPTARR
ncbi:MAG: hypothetical protein H0W96_02725 [Solirubrobacterales bacterium]|nr:hypothetical protein [Solirubrobacterales bacterium]